MSASWCSSCYNSIELIEELEAYWGIHNQNVKFVTSLADIGEPYSCEQWGLHGNPGSPLIVEDNGDLTNWFQDSNGGYPNYVVIDHEMRVRAKLSNILENFNTEVQNFRQVCPKEMLNKLDQTLSLKNKVSKAV